MQIIKINNILFFLLGIFFTIPVQIVGNFILGEIICFLILIFNIKTSLILVQKSRFLVRFSLLYLISYILILLSTLYNGNGPIALAKAAASFLFIYASTLAFLILFRRNAMLILPFLLGLALGKIFTPTHIDLGITLGNATYFEIYASVLTPLTIFISLIFRKNKALVFTIFMSYGIISLIFDARSLGFVFILSALFSWMLNSTLVIKKSSFYVSAILISFFVFQLYISSYSDNTTTTANSEQNQLTNTLDIINRNQTLVGLIAFADKPLFGHGYDKKTNEYNKLGISLGLLNIYSLDVYRIPTHSIIVGSAVSGGIIASLCWLYLFKYLINSLFIMVNYRVRDNLNPVLLFIILFSFWNLIFSPFGYARYTLPFLLAFFIIQMYLIQNNLKKQKIKILKK